MIWTRFCGFPVFSPDPQHGLPPVTVFREERRAVRHRQRRRGREARERYRPYVLCLRRQPCKIDMNCLDRGLTSDLSFTTISEREVTYTLEVPVANIITGFRIPVSLALLFVLPLAAAIICRSENSFFRNSQLFILIIKSLHPQQSNISFPERAVRIPSKSIWSRSFW